MTNQDKPTPRLLIVEDNEGNRHFMSEICHVFGWDYDTADDGNQCISALLDPSTTYNAILMDIHMPNKSGIEAAREIRARDQDPCQNIPIIAVSADDSDRNQDQCHGAGIDHFMSKPVNIYDLKEIVEGMIDTDKTVAV